MTSSGRRASPYSKATAAHFADENILTSRDVAAHEDVAPFTLEASTITSCGSIDSSRRRSILPCSLRGRTGSTTASDGTLYEGNLFR